MKAGTWSSTACAVAVLIGSGRPGFGQEAAGAGAAACLTNIAQVLACGNNLLRTNPLPVRLSGVCIATQPEQRRIFLQDGEDAVVVQHNDRVEGLKAGDWVEVDGRAVSSVGSPRVLSDSWRVTGTAPLPAPLATSMADLTSGARNGRYVTAQFAVRDLMWENRNLILLARSTNYFFRVYIPLAEGPHLPGSLIDARVEARGACLPFVDSRGAITGLNIVGMGLKDLTILDPGRSSLFDRPLETIAEVVSKPIDERVRCRIRGTVLGYVPTLDVAYLQDETGVCRVGFVPLLPPGTGPTYQLEHEPQTRPEAGERIEVIGAPFGNTKPQLFLLDGELRRLGRGTLPEPVPITVGQLRSEQFAHRLITMTARVISYQVLHFGPRDQRIWMVEADGQVFQVRQEDGFEDHPYPPGAWVRFTGVHELTSWRVPKSGDYLVFLRRSDDIREVASPPFWTLPEYRQPTEAACLVALLAVGGILLQRQKTRRAQASEERIRALLDNSFDATAVVGADGAIKYLSPAGVALIGAGPGDGRPDGRALAAVVHPDDLPRVLQAHQEVLDSPPGASQRLAGCRIRRPDGSIRHAEAVGTNCLHVPGVQGVVVNIRDITERTLADIAARRSERMTRAVQYLASSLLECDTEEDVVWDVARNCLAHLEFADVVVYLVTDGGAGLVERASLGAEPAPSGDAGAAHPLPASGLAEAAAASKRPELVADTRSDPRCRGDRRPRRSAVAAPILADSGVLGVIDGGRPEPGFFTDDHVKTLGAIASLCANKLVRIRAAGELRELNARLEQRVTERTAALKESEERFGKAFRASPALLSILRLPAGEHIDVNDAFLNTFGFRRDEVIGLNSFELGLWPEPGDGQALVDALKAGLPVRNLETVVRAKDGRRRTVVQAAEFLDIGRDRCAILVGQDVTERKRADEELRRAFEREKELNQLKSSFVSMVSHEFRTPLEVILSSNNILDRYFDRLGPEKREAQLRAIRKNVRRMSDLLDDVLLLGRIDAGRMECHAAPLDLDLFCRRVVADIESAAGCDGRVRFRADGIAGDAFADESILQHILSNLLGNALKYSPADSHVEFSVHRAGAQAEFVIRDFGRGIPKADQARLFTAFHRGANVGQTPGSGLGLVIVRHCVDCHNGVLRLDTAEGAGAVFTVVLPLFAGPGGAQLAPPPQPAPRPPVWAPPPYAPAPTPISEDDPNY